MKKLVFIILAVVFFVLGLVGLMIPVVPQVPFFVASALMIASISNRFRNFVINSKLYNKYLRHHVRKYKRVEGILHPEEAEKENQSRNSGMDMQ